MSNSILKVANLSYVYEDGTKALKKIDFNIKKGEKIAFIGGNGSGKSTMFLCLNGVLRPTNGNIYYEDKQIEYTRKGLLDLRSKVQIVFQDPDNQLFSASVYEEISFGILNLGIDEKVVERKVNEVIKELEIEPFVNKPTHFLSGGQKKRVSIADILVMDPEVIILDEPTSALDPKYTNVVNNLIDELTEKGKTVILSTHDVNQALKWADRIFVFMDGDIVKEGKPEEIFLDVETLDKANLLVPYTIKLYKNLLRKGILNENLKVPKTIEILEKYIEESFESKKG